MKFIEVAKYMERLELTSGRIDMIHILTELFKKASNSQEASMLAYIILGELHPPYTGLELGMSEKLIVRSIALASGYDTSLVDKRLTEVGDIGKVAEEFISRKKQVSLFPVELTLDRVYNTLDKIAKTSGEGSIDAKVKYLTSLLIDSSPLEARYIARLVDRTLRLGVADMTILEALALSKGSRELKPILEDAYNKYPDIGYIAKILFEEGIDGVKKIEVTPGIPVRPMLAERVKSPEEAWEKTGGKLAAEFKYDGERVQIHKFDGGNKILIFSRRLENITHQFPDLIEIVKKNVKAKNVIFEGEAVAFDPETGEFKPFQELMHRKRKHDIDRIVREIPVTLRAFDIIYLEGESLIKKPFIERRKKLEEIIEVNDYIKPSEIIYPKDIKELWEFFHLAIESGCEGLVIKSMASNAIYQAGARGWLWIKLKRDYRAELTDTLDLVVVGALYGRGRKGGLLSSFLMAVYDDKNDVFKTVCKVGTGFKDEDLTEINKTLKPLLRDRKPARVIAKMEPDVWVEPSLVLEIQAAEITLSPIHTCAYGLFQEDVGLALRFPRFTGRYRHDKSPEDATTEEEVIEMYKRQRKIVTEE
ncbi:MAG: ATP-dependent DNA ligase [Thermoprotei archaeon]|nr:MAG: ATP-dependent DNA ligase [Thermoprotei archaeon]